MRSFRRPSLGVLVSRSILPLVALLASTSAARAQLGSDICASADNVAGFGPFAYSLVGATDSPELVVEPPCNEAITKDVWFTWTAPANAWVRMNATTSGSALRTRVYANAGCPFGGTIIACGSNEFLAAAGSSYAVRIGVAPSASAATGAFWFVDVTAANDSCAAPVTLSGTSFLANTRYMLTGAEGQNDAACSGPNGTGILRDSWYSWTATFSGAAQLDACGGGASAGNFKAAVYVGGSCPSSNPLACDDDSCGQTGLEPRVPFAAVTGQTYVFQVGASPAYTSANDVSVSFVVRSIDAPVNDECATATYLYGNGPFGFDLALATTSTGHGGVCGPLTKDLWYRWVAPATGTATFDACSSPVDMLVAVYNGLGCPQGPAMACEDEGCGNFGPTRFTFAAQCGNAYLLRVGFYDAPSPISLGSFTLQVAGSACDTSIPFCTGDTPTACPCGNAGNPGRGCASSFSSQGAVIYSTGRSSVSSDSVGLRVEGASPSFVTLFQGTTQVNGGAGVLFGDGRRCAGGSVTRIVLRIANGGTLAYPSLVGDQPVSVVGQVPAGATRTYQGWYRDSQLSYCMSETFNLTNGMSLTWTP